ncbi:formylglycine-generating enzyme family protein [Treponema primitia]|uniref:formylglycine-generating enzyme family protein n=1 Tax=Treponema primitia TaxID=88058 RepID=UPI0005A1B200|nr:SUMF1/EgtB/PvdO family nonheme iron enzyme [Treponema primitia]
MIPALAIAWGLIAACTPALSAPSLTGEEESAWVRVILGDREESPGARTVVPADPLFSYTLTFTSDDYTEVKKECTDTDILVKLGKGDWELKVEGKKAGITVAESDTMHLSMLTKEAAPKTLRVVLHPLTTFTLADGSFRYDIQFDSGLTITEAGLTLSPIDSGTATAPIDLLLQGSGDISLAPGYYRLRVTARQNQQVAARGDIVHIYSDTQTAKEYTFTENDFAESVFLAGTANSAGYTPRWVYVYQGEDCTNQLADAEASGGKWELFVPSSYGKVYIKTELEKEGAIFFSKPELYPADGSSIPAGGDAHVSLAVNRYDITKNAMPYGNISMLSAAFENEQVSITVNPNNVYHLRPDSLRYTPEGAAAVVIPWTANPASFAMPARTVAMDAVFDSDIALLHVPSQGITFPTGDSDTGRNTLGYNFSLGETEVTYELWYRVRMWAKDHGYIFDNPGTVQGTDYAPGITPASLGNRRLQPITKVNWYDALVWCNAMTEWYNAETGSSFEPVYVRGNNVVRNSTVNTTTLGIKPGAKGFRLPSIVEWEFAARWQGEERDFTAAIGISSNGTQYYFTPGNYASGAMNPVTNNNETSRVAVFSGTAALTIKQRAPNQLGFYDMSGNVQEWCIETAISHWEIRGGSFEDDLSAMALGRSISYGPLRADRDTGFRVAQTE